MKTIAAWKGPFKAILTQRPKRKLVFQRQDAIATVLKRR